MNGAIATDSDGSNGARTTIINDWIIWLFLRKMMCAMNKLIALGLWMVAAVALWGCSTSSSPAGSGSGSCATVVCQNGGTCVSGTCDCPSGYTGTNCQTVVPGGLLFWTDCATMDTTGVIKVYFDTSGANTVGLIIHCAASVSNCSDNTGASFTPLTTGRYGYKAISTTGGRVWTGQVVVNASCQTIYLH